MRMQDAWEQNRLNMLLELRESTLIDLGLNQVE